MKKLLLILLSVLCLTACQPTAPDNQTPPITEQPEQPEQPEKPEQPKEDMGMWNTGYVGSNTNKSYPATINETDKTYIYSDVIPLGMKGVKASFTTNATAKITHDVYTVSSWKRDGNTWIIDPDGIALTSEKLIRTDNEDGTITFSYVAARDGENIRFCYRSGNPAFSEITYPNITLTQTDEEATAAPLVTSIEWCTADRDRAYYEILRGKKINFIGDSLFAGNSIGEYYVWPALLGIKYNMPYINYGISGCTLSAVPNGANPIINRYQKMSDNDPDIVVFEGGRNDYNKCAALGEPGTTDITTYRGALTELIRGLREKYPNALLIAVTFWKATDRLNDAGINCNEYTNVMREVCAELGVACISADNEDESGIKMTNKDFRLQYSMQAGDVCHLNIEGMRLALQFFEREIARIYSENTAKK